jgi:hypothetical protein
MTISGNSVGLSVTLPVHGSQAPQPAAQTPGGKVVPPSGNTTPAFSLPATAAAKTASPAAPQVAAGTQKVTPPNSYGAVVAAAAASAQSSASNASTAPDSKTVVAALNKYLNDTGRPDQFRIVSGSGGKVIQQVNPANGEVIGQFSVTEFPALAQSVVGGSAQVDSTA